MWFTTLTINLVLAATFAVANKITTFEDDFSESGKFTRSPVEKSVTHWKSISIYNVYPKSFKDSNGDGIGDINGIRQKLQHFVNLGIDMIWLNPFYPSPGKDNGYDVSDYNAIDPIYGTMADFDHLIAEMKKLGLTFMMDLVLNHCSDKHVWFKKSKEGIEPYKNYFIWRDPKGYDENNKPIPPNNWLCVFDRTAWTWVESRKQFYYHAFTEEQPDLNFRNPLVVEEFKNILRFWLDKGVMGIRLDAPYFLTEDEELKDEPYLTEEDAKLNPTLYRAMKHIYTKHSPEDYKICAELKMFVENEYTLKDGIKRILIGEIYGNTDQTTKWLPYVDAVYNFDLVSMPYYTNATGLDAIINEWMNKLPSGGVTTWNAENHDNYRQSYYSGEEFVDIVNILITMLPGSVCIYYGEEIGMATTILRPDQRRDTTNYWIKRDYSRTPMQWDDSFNAGFSSNPKPWLPVNSNYWKVNVKREKSTPLSHYNVLKELMKIRRTPVGRYGRLNTYVHSEWVYVLTREYENQLYVVVLNIGSESEIIDLTSIPGLPNSLEILISTDNSGYKTGDVISTSATLRKTTILRPKSGLVCGLAPTCNGRRKTDDSASSSSSLRVSSYSTLKILILSFLFLSVNCV